MLRCLPAPHLCNTSPPLPIMILDSEKSGTSLHVVRCLLLAGNSSEALGEGAGSLAVCKCWDAGGMLLAKACTLRTRWAGPWQLCEDLCTD